jgi:hypothetical protein
VFNNVIITAMELLLNYCNSEFLGGFVVGSKVDAFQCIFCGVHYEDGMIDEFERRSSWPKRCTNFISRARYMSRPRLFKNHAIFIIILFHFHRLDLLKLRIKKLRVV